MNRWTKFLAGALIFASLTIIPQAFSTLSDLDTRTVTAVGNGVTTNYTIGFTFQDNDEITVYSVVSATGVATEIFYGAGAGKFTITGGDPGTTVVMGTAPTSAEYLIITRDTPKTQSVNYDENAAFPADDHEEQMDRMVQMIQEMGYEVSTKIGFSTVTSGTAPFFPAPLANRILLYDSAAENVTYGPPSTTSLASGQVLRYTGSIWDAYDLDGALSAISGSLSNGFNTIDPPNGTNPVASTSTDTLTITSGDSTVTVTGDSSTDTIDFVVGSNLTNANLSASAAITRSKLAAGTASHVLINDGAGLSSSEAQLAVTRGGTGQSTYTDGQLLIGNSSGNTLTKASLTAGSGITVTPGSGSITISASGAGATYDQPDSIQNVGIAATLAANAMTIALKQQDASTNCSSGASSCNVAMGSSTTSGRYSVQSQTAALSLVVPAGATLGSTSAVESNQYVYWADTNGSGTNNKICVSGTVLDEGVLQGTSTIISGSSNIQTLYCDAVYSARVRLIGKIRSTQTTAGTWAQSLSEVSVGEFKKERWFVDATLTSAANVFDLGTSSVAAWAVIPGTTDVTLSYAPGSLKTYVGCSTTVTATGATCTSGSEEAGIAFTPPTSGWMEACFEGGILSDVGGAAATGTAVDIVQLVQTGNSDHTAVSTAGPTVSVANKVLTAVVRNSQLHPVHVCRKFYGTKDTLMTLRVFYKQTISSTVTSVNMLLGGSSDHFTDGNVRFTVTPTP